MTSSPFLELDAYVLEPLLIINPPPLDPTLSWSSTGEPSGFLSQISKKIKTAAGTYTRFEFLKGLIAKRVFEEYIQLENALKEFRIAIIFVT